MLIFTFEQGTSTFVEVRVCVAHLGPRSLLTTRCLLLALMQGIQQNSISGSYVLALFGQFCFMVVERVIYLNRSFKLKCVLQVTMLTVVLYEVHSTTGGELHLQEEVRVCGGVRSDVRSDMCVHRWSIKVSLGAPCGTRLHVDFMMVFCFVFTAFLGQTTGLLLRLICSLVYLLLGALQLSYGYQQLQTGQFLTRHIHWILGYVFLVYRRYDCHHCHTIALFFWVL